MSPELFESDPAQPDKKVVPGTYEQVLYALHHDRGVAENVFARRAKTDFAAALSNLNLKVQKVLENEYVYPLWTEQISITLDLKSIPTSHSDKELAVLARPIAALATRLVTTIKKSMDKDAALILVGSLSVKITDVGNGLRTLALKQKWAVTHE